LCSKCNSTTKCVFGEPILSPFFSFAQHLFAQLRRFRLARTATLRDLRTQCATIFGDSYHAELALTWLDGDGDEITCCSELEFAECVREQLGKPAATAVRLALKETHRNFRHGTAEVLGFHRGALADDDATVSNKKDLLQPANADALSVAHDVPAVIASFFEGGKIIPSQIPEFMQPAVRVIQRAAGRVVDLDINLELLHSLLSKHAIELLEQQRFVEARALLANLVNWKPDGVNWYNLACAHSLLRDLDDSMIALKAAIDAGYANLSHLLADEDLVNVRAHRDFPHIVNLLLEKIREPSKTSLF
jgi:hypothetical protein